MTTTVPKILTLTVDGIPYDVDKLPQHIQGLVASMDEIRQLEHDSRTQVMIAECAVRDMQRQILDAIYKERAEAEQRARAMGIVSPETEPTVGSTDGEPTP